MKNPIEALNRYLSNIYLLIDIKIIWFINSHFNNLSICYTNFYRYAIVYDFFLILKFQIEYNYFPNYILFLSPYLHIHYI